MALREQVGEEKVVLRGGPDNGRTMMIRYDRKAIITRNAPKTVYNRTEHRSGERLVFEYGGKA